MPLYNNQIYYVTIFQIYSAVNLDRNHQQWINLGNHPEVCLTNPETCGPAGGALSMWLSVDCTEEFESGIIASQGDYTMTRGFYIICFEGRILYVRIIMHLELIFVENSTVVHST